MMEKVGWWHHVGGGVTTWKKLGGGSLTVKHDMIKRDRLRWG